MAPTINPWIMFFSLICVWPILVSIPIAWIAYNRGRGRRFGFYDTHADAERNAQRAGVGYARAKQGAGQDPGQQPQQRRVIRPLRYDE